ncbi:MAG: hypothetical protein ACYCO0_03820 [Candidatus Micrarchaeaceae archaeon]
MPAVINRLKLMENLAAATDRLAERMAEYGKPDKASELFAHSAIRHVYLARLKGAGEREEGLRHALEIALRSDSPNTFDIAIEHLNSVMTEGNHMSRTILRETAPRRGYDEESLNDFQCGYTYKIRIDEEGMEKLISRFSETDFADVLRGAMVPFGYAAITDNERPEASIKVVYDSGYGTLSIGSIHQKEDHDYIKSTIISIAGTIGLILDM